MPSTAASRKTCTGLDPGRRPDNHTSSAVSVQRVVSVSTVCYGYPIACTPVHTSYFAGSMCCYSVVSLQWPYESTSYTPTPWQRQPSPPQYPGLPIPVDLLCYCILSTEYQTNNKSNHLPSVSSASCVILRSTGAVGYAPLIPVVLLLRTSLASCWLSG
jgi:hypothetical protein